MKFKILNEHAYKSTDEILRKFDNLLKYWNNILDKSNLTSSEKSLLKSDLNSFVSNWKKRNT